MSEDTKVLQVTSASELKERARKNREGELVELPSGIVLRVARPQLVSLLTGNAVPGKLSAIALKLINGGKAQLNNVDEMNGMMALVDKVVVSAVVEPKVVEKDPAENEVGIADLSDDDKLAIFSYVQSGEAGLEKFRRQLSGGQS